MDDSPASKLPVELWIEIAITLYFVHGPISDPSNGLKVLRPLSNSCRFLHAIVQPMLYKWIKVDASNMPADKIASLAFTLSTRSDLRSSISTLHLIGVEAGAHCDVLLEVLPQLVEVRSLSIKSGIIEEAIVQLLRNAVRLRKLWITNTRWGENIRENWSEHGSFGGDLRELSICDWNPGQVDHASKTLQLFMPTVTKLYIDTKLTMEFMDSPAFLSIGPSLLQLYTLAYDSISYPALHQLLSRSPNLGELYAGKLSSISSIEAELLPKLHTIWSDVSVVSALLPGRPIRSITTKADPKIFASPLPELETLCLHGLSEEREGLEVINALLGACPGLIKLSLIAASKWKTSSKLNDWLETRLTSELVALPRLQILHVKCDWSPRFEMRMVQHPLSEEMRLERERIIQVKQQHCPDLNDVWIHPDHAWMYSQDDGAWISQRRINIVSK